MQTALCRAPLASGPATLRASVSTRRAAIIRCSAQQPQRQQAAAAAPSAALALSSLLAAAPALAEEAAAAEAPSAGLTALGWGLIVSPIVFYGLFNVYRSQIDPKAKFGDAIFIFAALIILSNIISITVFKIRLF